MRQSSSVILLAVLVSYAYAAPQFISFNEGKLGVNFGGYHAAVGLGGAVGSGAGGGLFAEAGTPFGQAARAGLGGAVDGGGGSAGGLYAGATAGGNVRAAAGLSGGVTAEKSAGAGYASAQAGDHIASSGLGGETSAGSSSGFTFSGSKSFGISSGVVKHGEVAVQPIQTVQIAQPVQTIQTVEVVKPAVYKEIHTEVRPVQTVEIQPVVYKEVHTEVQPVQPVHATSAFSFSKSFGVSSGIAKQAEVAVQPVEIVKPVHKEVHTEIKSEVTNEVNPLPLATAAKTNVEVNVAAQAPPTYIVKEVYVQPPPTKVVYRTHYKPHRHHFRKTAYIGGYIGGGGEAIAPPPPPPPPPAPVVYKSIQPVVYKTVQPVIEKRVDVGVESAVNAGAHANVGAVGGGGGQYTYTKQVAVQSNPTFFADIFNIPISTLKAVGNFLGNAAGGTSVSVQKSASVHADSDSISSKHQTLSPSSSVSSSESHISVQTPPASKFIDDIFAIPINTLSAVNKFLENNVPARKNVQVSESGEPTKVRLGPHARRRANKQKVVVVEQSADTTDSEPKPFE